MSIGELEGVAEQAHDRKPGHRPRRQLPWRLRSRALAVPGQLAGWPAALLALSVFLAGPLTSVVPGAGLDPSWHVGLNQARAYHLRWGYDLVYTYGPWGYLDQPNEISQAGLVVGAAFAIGAVIVLWTAAYVLLLRALPPLWAAVLSSVIVVLAAASVPKSTVLFAGVVAAAFGYVGQRTARRHVWVPAAVTAAGALLLQMKTSEGLVVLLLGGIAAVCSGRGWWRRLIEVVLAAVITTALAWWLAGQRLSDYPHWLHGTLQVSSGYTDAMGDTSPNDELNFTLLALLALVLIGLFIQLWRASDRPVTSRLGILAMSGGLFEFAIKQAARAGHDHFTYVYLLPAVLWFFVAGVRHTGLRAVALATVMLLSASSWPGQPDQLSYPWYSTFALVTDSHYHHQQVELARKNARATYNLSPTIQGAIDHHPLTVDAWEAALPWAYRQSWAPAPTMQTYVAYTPYLDRLNASSIATAPMNRRIMRYRQGAIDARNALWDSPQYVLTELCSYRPVASDAAWLVLAKAAASRCGGITPLSQSVVHAGQPITLPTVGPNSILVMSFHERKAGLLNRLGVAALKSFHPLRVKTANLTYRLPRALAEGPLIVTLPATTGWTDPFTRTQLQSTVAFSDDGSVDFSTIELGT